MRQYFLSTNQFLETDRFVVFSGSEIVVREEQYLWSFDEISALVQHVTYQVLIDRDEPGIVAIDLADDLRAWLVH